MWQNDTTLHIPCTNVSFLRLIFSHDYVRCNYLGDIGEGYRGSFCIIFSTPCESIIISKVKIKQIKQTKGGKKEWAEQEVELQNRPRDSLSWPHGELRSWMALHSCFPWGQNNLAFLPQHRSLSECGKGLALGGGCPLPPRQSLEGLRTEGCWLRAPPAPGPSLKGSGRHSAVAPMTSSCTSDHRWISTLPLGTGCDPVLHGTQGCA